MNKTLTTLHLHDDIIIGSMFEFEEKQYLVFAVDGINGEEYKIVFENVIGIMQTACDFWGPDNRINEIRLCDKEEMIAYNSIKLIGEEKDPENENGLNDTKYREFMIEKISGDEIHIVCENINVEKCDKP